MKILNISQCDYANFQYDNMKALRSVGIDCDSVVLERHPFYEEQSEVVPNVAELCALIRNYDVIQFFHDNMNLWRGIAVYCLGKRVIAYHTSSNYRANHVSINSEFKKWNVSTRIACMPEFVAMCPGSIYMVGAVDTDKLCIEYEGAGFAHYPSNSIVKGTNKIEEIFRILLIELQCNTSQVSHKEQINRIANCRVYVEMFTERDGLGSPYGNFGITTLEAAAMGKPVITNCKDWEVYYNVYGKLPFCICNDEAEFIKQVMLFWTGGVPYWRIYQDQIREMIVDRHSYKATGDYFIKNVLNHGK